MTELGFRAVGSAEDATGLADALERLTPAEVVTAAARELGSDLVLAASFGLEDVALIDMLSKGAAASTSTVRIATLDTGRLPPETYPLIDRIEARYRVRIETFFPDTVAVESLVRRQGHNGFMASVDARKACCAVRKIEPLGRALGGARAWMTGLRRDQSVTRTTVRAAEWDGRLKISPLVAWTLEDVWAYVRHNDVPYSPLHDRGYPSIGCAPCTRAIEPGEHERAGRWWWESPDHKECGLHTDRAAALRAARARQ